MGFVIAGIRREKGFVRTCEGGEKGNKKNITRPRSRRSSWTRRVFVTLDQGNDDCDDDELLVKGKQQQGRILNSD